MEPVRFRAKFDDIRELGLTAGWDLEFRQLSYGRQDLVGEFLVGEQLTVVDLNFNRAFHQLGFAPPGTITIGIPYAGVRRWFGRDCGRMSILPFNQASGFDCVSEEAFSGWTLSISEAYLQHIADRCSLPFDERLWRPKSEVLISDSAATRSLYELIRTCTKRSKDLLDPAMEENIAIAVLEAARVSNFAERSGPAETRASAVRCARVFPLSRT